MRLGALLRSQVLGMHARTSNAGKAQVEALGKRRVDIVRRQFHLWINRAHLSQRIVPERIKVVRLRVAPRVLEQLRQRHVDQRHSVGAPLFGFLLVKCRGNDVRLKLQSSTHDLKRIDRLPADANFPVQMRPRNKAGRADFADLLAFLHRVAFAYVALRQVHVN